MNLRGFYGNVFKIIFRRDKDEIVSSLVDTVLYSVTRNLMV
jgi:hypothetical protein